MNEQMPGAVHEGADAAEDDLGASENEPLLHPDQRGQEGPRPSGWWNFTSPVQGSVRLV